MRSYLVHSHLLLILSHSLNAHTCTRPHCSTVNRSSDSTLTVRPYCLSITNRVVSPTHLSPRSRACHSFQFTSIPLYAILLSADCSPKQSPPPSADHSVARCAHSLDSPSCNSLTVPNHRVTLSRLRHRLLSVLALPFSLDRSPHCISSSLSPLSPACQQLILTLKRSNLLAGRHTHSHTSPPTLLFPPRPFSHQPRPSRRSR